MIFEVDFRHENKYIDKFNAGFAAWFALRIFLRAEAMGLVGDNTNKGGKLDEMTYALIGVFSIAAASFPASGPLKGDKPYLSFITVMCEQLACMLAA